MLRLFEVFFFSLRLLHWIKAYLNKLKYTTVVKLAYTLDSKSSGAIHKGSIPFSRTNKKMRVSYKGSTSVFQTEGDGSIPFIRSEKSYQNIDHRHDCMWS